jgi:Putative metallopeptidase domain
MARLRSRVPFFGTLALYARFVPDPSMPTAATDGRDVFYNPDFFASLPSEHLDAVVVHEVLHAALGHVHRRGGRDAMRWNQAADVVVNGLIVGAGMELPDGALRDASMERFSVEEVYTLFERTPTPPDAVDRDLLDAAPDSGPGGSGEGGDPTDGRGTAPAPRGRPRRSAREADRDDTRHWAAAVERAAAQ